MIYHVIIRRLAEAELAESVACYNLQGQGLGDQLLDAVNDAIRLLSENPKLHPHYYKDVRRAVVKRFPFLIYYQIRADATLRILRIVHAARDPENVTKLLP